MSAGDAQAMGPTNRLFPAEGFIDSVLSEARVIAEKSMIPLSMAKTAINAFVNSGGQCGKAVEIQSVCICFASNDQKEGMAAFLEKRKPVFSDD